jgi:mRNA interferase MazF
LVLAALQGADVILCQITSQARSDIYSVTLDSTDFMAGGLNQSSRIRPNRLFTADEGIISYSPGHILAAKMNEVLDRLGQRPRDILFLSKNPGLTGL